MLSTPVANADCYLEISFSNISSLLTSGTKLTLGTRITNATWSNFNQLNDYSYGSNDNVVLIYDNQIISGTPANN